MASLESLIKAKRTTTQSPAFSVTMIHYTKLIPSEMNAYSTESIEELANMIMLSGGVKQNLLARKTAPEEYELIAGHRRRLAVKYLVEERGLKEFAMVPVHVEKDGDLLSEIDLILTNCGARERSDWEKMMESTRMADLVKALQKGTEEEQKRFRAVFGCDPNMNARDLRKLVADTLGLSVTKVANLNHINSGLALELKERFKNGDIGVTVANEAAGLPPKRQIEIAEKETISIADVRGVKSVSESDTDKEEQIPGQMEIVSDFPEILPAPASDLVQEDGEKVTEMSVSESDTLQNIPDVAPEDVKTTPVVYENTENVFKTENQEGVLGVSESDTLSLSQRKEIFEKVVKDQRDCFEHMKSHWEKRPDIYWRELMKLEAYKQYLERMLKE